MASRAQVIHTYPASDSLRPRRDVWFRDDEEPVVLPRRPTWSLNLALVLAAVAAAALTIGATYAIYDDSAPVLAPDGAVELTPTWTPDDEPVRARLQERLSGPAHALPSLEQAPVEQSPLEAERSAARQERDLTGDESSSMAPLPDTHLDVEPLAKPDESAAPTLPKPEASPPATYPNPTTTPPEVMPPLDSPPAPQTPGRMQDNENPY